MSRKLFTVPSWPYPTSAACIIATLARPELVHHNHGWSQFARHRCVWCSGPTNLADRHPASKTRACHRLSYGTHVGAATPREAAHAKDRNLTEMPDQVSVDHYRSQGDRGARSLWTAAPRGRQSARLGPERPLPNRTCVLSTDEIEEPKSGRRCHRVGERGACEPRYNAGRSLYKIGSRPGSHHIIEVRRGSRH